LLASLFGKRFVVGVKSTLVNTILELLGPGYGFKAPGPLQKFSPLSEGGGGPVQVHRQTLAPSSTRIR
jgi:hypothetical protein